MSFSFLKLNIPEVILIQTQSHFDSRGFFLENYKKSIFDENGINEKFVQENFSYSVKGVVRGLHFQKNPHAQAKLVSVLKGKIFDVAVDIRKNSPTYGKWVGETISDKNHSLLYIPQGFAHGFCVLSDEAYVSYKVTQEYSPEHEKGIIWNDPNLNIKWPIDNPILNEKDLQLPELENTENNFSYESH